MIFESAVVNRWWLGALALAVSPPVQAQPSLVPSIPVAGEIPLILRTTPGRMYRWESSPDLTQWSPLPLAVASRVPLVAQAASMNLSAPATGPKQFYRVGESLPFDPAWADVKPLRIIPFQNDSSGTALSNGAALKTAMQALLPGDHLVISPGTYSIQTYTNLNLLGTAQAPIRITAGPSGGVIITRPDAEQNVLNLGKSAPCRYLALQGLEMTGGADGLSIGNCSEIWVDRCNIHDVGDSGIRSQSHNADHLFITRNEIHHTNGGGDGVALGITGASVTTSQSVVALNHIHHTNGPGVSFGSGVVLKQGSWGNLISGNTLHDCFYPNLLVSNTNGAALNILENNICYNGAEYGIQVAADCIVRNNFVIATAGAFFSGPVQGVNPTRVSVVHNTFISTSRAVRLGNWTTGSSMVFANNACYSRDAESLYIVGGAGSTVFAGLVTYGPLSGGGSSAATGTGTGTGLADFVNVTWDGANRDATPSPASPLRGTPSGTYLTDYDMEYHLRTAPQATGSHR